LILQSKNARENKQFLFRQGHKNMPVISHYNATQELKHTDNTRD